MKITKTKLLAFVMALALLALAACSTGDPQVKPEDRLLMADGRLFYGADETGPYGARVVDDPFGEIVSTVKPDEVPTEDGQSNFGEIGATYVRPTSEDDEFIMVEIDEAWYVFYAEKPTQPEPTSSSQTEPATIESTTEPSEEPETETTDPPTELATEATTAPPTEPATDPQSIITQPSPIGKPPEITVTVNGQPVEYSIGLNMWDGAIVDRLDTLQFIMMEDSGIEVPYIKLGGTIAVEFKDNPPATVTLHDKIINTDGSSRYAEQVTEELPLERDGDKLSSEFVANPAAFLSSNSADYEDGNTYRGFYLRCKWDNGNDCEYGFVVRTDAGSIGNTAIRSEYTPEMFADDLFTYLRRNLSAETYGGMYKEISESSAKVVIWVVDSDEYSRVLGEYKNELCEVEVKESSCSLSDMEAMKESIRALGNLRENIPNMGTDEQTNRLRIELFENADSDFVSTLQRLIDNSGIRSYVEVGTGRRRTN
jgi:hypothetical protein